MLDLKLIGRDCLGDDIAVDASQFAIASVLKVTDGSDNSKWGKIDVLGIEGCCDKIGSSCARELK